MNALQVKTINLTPAVVEFNFEELSAILNENLKKYDGLTFTEKDAAACKKTIAELNKGKKALDTYRKDTKKELTASVTAFENQCKELNKKFDEVINPLKEQYDQFENDRKELKRKQIREVIDQLIEQQGLNETYAAQLIIPEEYFNKSKTLKSIKDELSTKAEHLGIQQDKEEADQEIIKSHVQLINTKYDTNLPESAYLSLLAYTQVAEVKERIEADAEKEVEKCISNSQVVSPVTKAVDKSEKIYFEQYQVEGTEYELKMLEEYMSSNGLTWKVIENA